MPGSGKKRGRESKKREASASPSKEQEKEWKQMRRTAKEQRIEPYHSKTITGLSQAEHEVERRVLLDVIVLKSTAFLKLLAVQ